MILNVILQNWKNHEYKEFNFKEGLNLIFGPNASGKTSVMQAIFYALNGESPEKHGPLDFKRNGSDEACVELSFVSKDGKEFFVRRYISGEKRVSERAHLYVSENGEQPTEVASKPDEVNSRLGEILGFGTQYFLRTLYMKEGDVYEFLQNPSNKVLSEIDQMLQLDKIKSLIEPVKNLSKIKKRESKSRKYELKDIQKPSAEKEDLTRRKEELENRITEIKFQQEELESRQKDTSEAMNILKSLEDIVQKIKDNSSRLTQLISDLKEEGSPKEKLKEAIRKTQDNLEKQKNNGRETQTRVLSLKNRIKEVNENLSKLEEARERCPLCNQKLTPEHIEKIKKDFSSTLQKLQKELDDSEKEYESILKEIEVLEKRLNDLQNREREMETIFGDLKKLNEEKSQQENQFPSSQPRNKEKLEASLGEIESQIKQKRNEIEATIKEIGQIEGRMESVSKSTSELEQEIRTLVHQEFITATMLEALERTLKRLREERLVQVKQKAAKLLSKFKPRIWTVDWDKNFVPQLTSPERSLSAYQLSGAEKLQLFLVIRLAIASLIGEPDFILLDEPVYHLDQEKKKLIYSILKEYTESSGIRQLIVSSFEPELEKQDWNNKIILGE